MNKYTNFLRKDSMKPIFNVNSQQKMLIEPSISRELLACDDSHDYEKVYLQNKPTAINRFNATLV